MTVADRADLIRVDVELEGMDSNAFAIIANVAKALQRAGNSREVVDEFRKEAMSGDYDNVLRTAMSVIDR